MARANPPANDLPALDARMRDLLAQADRQRANGLAQLAQVRAARAVVLQRDLALLVARKGEQDPSVRVLSGRLARASAEREVLAREAERSSRAAPKPDPCAFTVYGYVTSLSGAGLAKLRVTVHGCEPAPSAYTDGSGHFVLRVPVPEKPFDLRLKVMDGHGATLYEQEEPVLAEAGALRQLLLTIESLDER